MKLPKELPELQAPFFVLAAPAWMQWPMMALVLLVPLAGYLWLYAQYRTVGLEVYHYVIAVILLGVHSASFGPNFFRKWARLAVDEKGIYFGDVQYRFTLVPWNAVGEVIIVQLSGGRKGVLIELKVTNEVWRQIYPLQVMYGLPRVKKYPIQNTGHKAEYIQENIERIRPLSND